MAGVDKLQYFDMRARGEPIRMIYAIAGKEIEDIRISFTEWPANKPGKIRQLETSLLTAAPTTYHLPPTTNHIPPTTNNQTPTT